MLVKLVIAKQNFKLNLANVSTLADLENVIKSATNNDLDLNNHELKYYDEELEDFMSITMDTHVNDMIDTFKCGNIKSRIIELNQTINNSQLDDENQQGQEMEFIFTYTQDNKLSQYYFKHDSENWEEIRDYIVKLFKSDIDVDNLIVVMETEDKSVPVSGPIVADSFPIHFCFSAKISNPETNTSINDEESQEEMPYLETNTSIVECEELPNTKGTELLRYVSNSNGNSIANGVITSYLQPIQYKPLEFVKPPENLPGISYRRVKKFWKLQGKNKSVVIDNATGQSFPKHRQHEERIIQRQKQEYDEKVSKLEKEFEAQVALQKKDRLLESGKNGAIAGLIGSAVSSSIINVVDVYKGKKDKTTALKEVAVHSVKGALMGGTISLITEYAMQSTKISNCYVVPALFTSWEVLCQFKDYYCGKLSKKQLAVSLTRLAVGTISSVAGGFASVSLVSLFIPGVGPWISLGVAAAGSLLASTASQKLMKVSEIESLLGHFLDENPSKTLLAALLFFGLKEDNMYKVNERYKTLAKIYHPDLGGTDESFTQLHTYYNIIVSAQNHREPTIKDIDQSRTEQ